MERVLLDEVVDTDYGQLDLVYDDEGGFDGEADRFFAGQVNGWVGAADPHGVYVCLARRSGGSQVRVCLLDGPPDDDPSWEDVVEVSTRVPDGAQVAWTSWAGGSGGLLDGVPAGDLRVRVSARGRDAGADGELEDEVVDSYLIELWPAPGAPDEIVRTTSENAAYWHREWGSRR